MKFSHIKDEVLEKREGGSVAVKAPKQQVATMPTAASTVKKLEVPTKVDGAEDPHPKRRKKNKKRKLSSGGEGAA